MCLLTLIATGCEKKNEQTTLSSVAQLNAFSFAKNDSMPGLAAAVFTIEERNDTGLVWNKDSILFGTRLDSVVPRFTFETTPSAAYLTFPDTIVALTGYDTLDFTKRPIYLTVRSADKSTTKTYEIRATVHRVDPDLYQWSQLTEGIYPKDDSEQRVVELREQFVMIASNGFELHTFSSTDGATWSDFGAPSGLPAGTKVRQIISSGNTLYYGQDNAVYTSTDAQTWTSHSVTQTVRTMLVYWNERVWALTGEEDNYELATFQGDTLQLTGLKPDGEFPISDFAAVTFLSPSLRERAMIIGGFAENGRSLNTRWNIEYSPHTPENGGYRMQEFSIDRPQFTSLTGISVISYNNQLLLFGGVDDKMQYFGRDILISTDEGLNWTIADTTKNRLPEVYQARQKQTAIVRNNNIFLFGGQDATTTYSDVYKGRLNSIDWDNN
ncbi:MAG: hypothetical protein J6T80_02435 [Paludibacteraceae bacterium]|nr:hypothetical protein [Paludibacteraceae bacterium]